MKDTDSKETKRKDFRLPVIVPCVLYNGENNWTVVRSFRETLARNEDFGEFVLDFKYILFDVRRYSDEILLNLANVIGAAFFVDKTKDKEELLARLRIITQRLQSLTDDDIGTLWKWLKNIVARGLSEEKQKQIEEIFQKERKMDNMVYAIERIMEQERVDAENSKSIEIARKLIKIGVPLEKVVEGTDLPLATIQELAQSMQQQ